MNELTAQFGTLCLEDMGMVGLTDEERNAILASFHELKPKTQSILIVEDDLELSWLLEAGLRQRLPDAEICVANDPYEALNLILERNFALIVLDWNLQGINGMEMLHRAEVGLQMDPSLPPDRYFQKAKVLVVSASPPDQCKLKRFEHFRPAGYVPKDQGLNSLLKSIQSHCRA